MLGSSGGIAVQNKPILLRVLWEDNRYGRVSLVMDAATCARSLLVEVPVKRRSSGTVCWQPVNELDGGESDAVRTLLIIVRELAGDVYFNRVPSDTDDMCEDMPLS
jgi:hypothetical protein